MEVIFGIYGREADEIAVRSLQFIQEPFQAWTIIFIVTTYFIPVALWLPRRARRNLWIMSLACISVNIGMWLERYLIIVPGLANRTAFTFSWNSYVPSVYEAIIVGATFAFVSMLLLLFSRVFPLIPLYDIKEGDILKNESVKIGRRVVPAVFRED